MSDYRFQTDAAQPADLTRTFNLIRIILATMALALAVWLAFATFDHAKANAEALQQARFETDAAIDERGAAVNDRNAAITALEEMRTGKSASGLSGDGLARVDGRLLDAEARTEELRGLAVTSEVLAGQRILPMLNQVKENIAEARKYIQATRATPAIPAPPEAGAPKLTPSNWFPEEEPARLIPASLNAAAPPGTPPIAGASVPSLEAPGLATARTRLYITLGILAALGLIFVLAVVVIFSTRDTWRHAFAGDTIKTLLGVFAGAAIALMWAPV